MDGCRGLGRDLVGFRHSGIAPLYALKVSELGPETLQHKVVYIKNYFAVDHPRSHMETHGRADSFEIGGTVPGHGLVVLAIVLPVVLTSAMAALASAVAIEVGQLEAYTLYGVANVLVLGGFLAAVTDRGRGLFVPVVPPTATEVIAAATAFVIGLLAFQVATWINGVLGTSMSGMDYALGDPATLAMVIFGAVLVAPVAEEVLFRGLLVGYLLDRGISPVVAGLIAVLAFAVIHLPNFGMGGAVFILLWAPLPTALRLRFENLTGAWLMHAANNLFAYVIVVGWLS